ncbi:MAG: hypothetical protein GX442_08355 [Candidatus Riflebacteria bacterium]|nr:hypothetical protein [Candidatus Riflebacteria bacterium]
MRYQTRTAFLLAALFVLTLPFTSSALEGKTIPEGIDVVVILANHTNLPLQDLVDKNPLIPPPAKDMFSNFTKAVSFNPLTDISGIQAMLDIDGKAGLVVASGKFDVEKITAQVKLAGTDKVTPTQFGTVQGLVAKDGKAAMCLPDASTFVGGTPDLVGKYVEAAAARTPNEAYAPLLAKASDKAYVTVMAAGDSLGKLILEKFQEKANKRELPPQKAILRDWAQKYFLFEFTGKSLLAQQADNHFELWLTYDRPEAKDCVYHLLSENTDARFRIDTAFQEFIKVLSTLPAPEPKDRPALGQ